MKRKQAEQVLNENLKKIYGFTLTKTASLQDAEDLTREIALKIYSSLMSQEVSNTNAFIWRIVNNMLANYYRGKARKGIGVCIDEVVEGLINEEDICQGLIQREDIKRIQSEIAYLSKMQRKIVVLYYYEGKKQEEIAKILGLSIGTVKWHLFEAKSEIKKGMEKMRDVKELRFNPIKFDLMGQNGSIGDMGGISNFFRSTLSQNIAYCVWKEGKTINEIADCLGVSPVYVETEVEFLEEYGFLLKQGKKYLSNMIIDENTAQISKLQSQVYEEAATLYANALFDELINNALLKDKGLYYPDEDTNFLMWTIIFYIAAVSGEKLIEEKITFEEATTRRPDGGQNIAYASIIHPDIIVPKYFEDIKKWCGPCWNSTGDLMLWQIDSEWSTKRVDDSYQKNISRDLNLFRRLLDGDKLSIDEYTYMAEKGYIQIEKDCNDQVKANFKVVCIYNDETKNKLLQIGEKLKERYKDRFNELKLPYVKAVLAQTPKHLQKMQSYGLQFMFHADGWFLLHCAKVLVNNGKLKLPTEEQKKVLTMLVVSNR